MEILKRPPIPRNLTNSGSLWGWLLNPFIYFLINPHFFKKFYHSHNIWLNKRYWTGFEGVNVLNPFNQMSWEKSPYMGSLTQSWTWMGKYASCESLLTISILPSAWMWEQAAVCMNGFWKVRHGKIFEGVKKWKGIIWEKTPMYLTNYYKKKKKSFSFTLNFLNWILTPGIWETALFPQGPSKLHPCQTPIV